MKYGFKIEELGNFYLFLINYQNIIWFLQVSKIVYLIVRKFCRWYYFSLSYIFILFNENLSRTKLKQTEVDCEFLKKCCETLTDENMRLQKEIQELKTLKLTHQPFYMHMPASTLTMCPSCERIGGSVATAVVVDGSTAKGAFSISSKPHFFNPFTNPSAACWIVVIRFLFIT